MIERPERGIRRVAAFMNCGESRDLDLVAGLYALADREGTIVIDDEDGRSEARIWVDSEPDAAR